MTRLDDGASFGSLARVIHDRRPLRERYQVKDYRVRVHVIRGKRLPPKDLSANCDPYLLFSVGDGTRDGLCLS